MEEISCLHGGTDRWNMKHKYINIQHEKHNVKSKLYLQDDGRITDIVIYGHGFAGHKDTKAAERLADKIISKNKGFALMAFDLPCHGDDVKKKLLLEDCETYYGIVNDYAKNVLGAQKLYLNATSFGAFLVLRIISENGNPYEKAVFRSPAINMFGTLSSSLITDEVLEKLNRGKDALIGFDRKVSINKHFLDEIEATDLNAMDFIDYADDMLIIHGTKDEIAPFEDAKAFAENNVIDFVPVENADHRYKDLQKLEYANSLAVSFYGL